MRKQLLVLAAAFACGCGEGTRPEPVPVGEYAQNLQRFFEEDAVVLQTVLDDLVAFDQFLDYPHHAAGDKVVVWNRSEGSSWFVSPGQVSSELRQDRPVPSGLLEELQSRNHRSLPLEPLKPSSARFLLEPPMEIPKEQRRPGRDFFKEKYPNAGAHVGFWMPAYTPDGRTALVRFAFGPTAHGACGTYRLDLANGKWTVTWRRLSYYA